MAQATLTKHSLSLGAITISMVTLHQIVISLTLRRFKRSKFLSLCNTLDLDLVVDIRKSCFKNEKLPRRYHLRPCGWPWSPGSQQR